MMHTWWALDVVLTYQNFPFWRKRKFSCIEQAYRLYIFSFNHQAHPTSSCVQNLISHGIHIVQFQKISVPSPPPKKVFCFVLPQLPGNSSLSSCFLIMLGFQWPSVGEDGYFLEPHIACLLNDLMTKYKACEKTTVNREINKMAENEFHWIQLTDLKDDMNHSAMKGQMLWLFLSSHLRLVHALTCFSCSLIYTSRGNNIQFCFNYASLENFIQRGRVFWGLSFCDSEGYDFSGSL